MTFSIFRNFENDGPFIKNFENDGPFTKRWESSSIRVGYEITMWEVFGGWMAKRLKIELNLAFSNCKSK